MIKVQITPPTWQTAVKIYMDVLQNPKAPAKSVAAARAELMRLAEWADSPKGE